MSRTMALGCRQQRDIVGLTQTFHELGHELVWGQAAQPSVFCRYDDVEPPARHCDGASSAQPPKRCPRCDEGRPEGHCSLLGREVISAPACQISDEVHSGHWALAIGSTREK